MRLPAACSFAKAASWQKEGLSKDRLGGSHGPACVWPRSQGRPGKLLGARWLREEGRIEGRMGERVSSGQEGGKVGDHLSTEGKGYSPFLSQIAWFPSTALLSCNPVTSGE